MASFEIRIRLIISSYPICFYIAFCEIILFLLFNIDDDDDDDDDNDYDQRGFVVWLTNERRLALFSAWTIATRDFHNRESPTRREQDLNLCRT